VSERQRVLVADDDPLIQRLIRTHLDRAGFRVLSAADGEEALDVAAAEQPDLIVLDLMLPKLDGFDVCKRIREFSLVPVVMLTARGEQVDKLRGFEAGADDYLTKPFAFGELTARVQALARRSRSAAPPILERAGIRLDPHRRTVTRDGEPVGLSRKEFAVLAELLRADGGVVSAEQLLEKAWDENTDPFTGVVRFTIMMLRRKLGEPVVIETVPASGYRIA
jgi:DNA-binding response OmpR family regulator